MADPKIAIVHDWITNLGGAERTVASLLKAFPQADLYTSVYDPANVDLFNNVEVRTTWLQKIPGRLKYKHQLWAVLRPLAFRSLDLSAYDVVISSSSAESKQVQVRDGAKHICYCHTPIRYYWVKPDEYMKNPGLGFLDPLARLVLPVLLKSLKKSDYKAAQKVDVFLANSRAVQDRILMHYDRESQVVYPPVETSRFSTTIKQTRAGFVTAGRQVAYKQHALAVQACTELELPLLVLGNGPEHDKLMKIAGPTIEFITDASNAQFEQAFQASQAFIHPGEEDFGITPIEAMAAGCPVIAYQAGGALDYINSKSGMFFTEQTVDSLKEALQSFNVDQFSEKRIKQNADKYSEVKFIKTIKKIVAKQAR